MDDFFGTSDELTDRSAETGLYGGTAAAPNQAPVEVTGGGGGAPVAHAPPLSSSLATELFGHVANDVNMCKDPVSVDPGPPVTMPGCDLEHPETCPPDLEGAVSLDFVKWLGTSAWKLGKGAVDLFTHSPIKGPMLPPIPKKFFETTPTPDDA